MYIRAEKHLDQVRSQRGGAFHADLFKIIPSTPLQNFSEWTILDDKIRDKQGLPNKSGFILEKYYLTGKSK